MEQNEDLGSSAGTQIAFIQIPFCTRKCNRAGSRSIYRPVARMCCFDADGWCTTNGLKQSVLSQHGKARAWEKLEVLHA